MPIGSVLAGWNGSCFAGTGRMNGSFLGCSCMADSMPRTAYGRLAPITSTPLLIHEIP